MKKVESSAETLFTCAGAMHKILKSLEFIKAIPRILVGKISIKELAKRNGGK